MRIWAALAFFLALSTSVAAQDAGAVVSSPLLVIETERVFLDSEKGQAIRAELKILEAELQAENDRIAAELEAEEQDLAKRRPDMEPEAFRAEANAFDEKVQNIRRARDAKDSELKRQEVEARNQFFQEMRPIVGQILIERGGVAVIDSRTVYIYLRSADITDAVIELVDRPNVDQE